VLTVPLEIRSLVTELVTEQEDPTMREQLAQVLEFHRTFACHISARPTAVIPKEIAEVRARLLREELEEYCQAAAAGDIVEIADALSDMLYVLLGTYISHGLDGVAEGLFNEVHRSNMSKLGPDGQPVLRADGKILKPDQFRAPQLAPIIQAAGGADGSETTG
jgi:predicted HAD superfamily Cof-like phosphohydrolase